MSAQGTLFGDPPNEMIRTAEISADRRYRYMLGRSWAGGPRAVFVMLNPSTADALTDDPTIRRCVGFARSWGLGGITVVNLYALRATDPTDLWAVDDPVGPENDRWLRWAANVGNGSVLVGAWGAQARPDRVADVLRLPGFRDIQALGTTRAGQPRHPLYLPASAELRPWAPERVA